MKKSEIRFYSSTSAQLRLVEGRNISQHTFPVHVHASYCIGLVLDGLRSLHVDGRDLRFSPGECFVLNPFQAHACLVDGDRPHDYVVVCISPACLQLIDYARCSAPLWPYFSQARLSDDIFIHALQRWLAQEDRDDAVAWLRLEKLITSVIQRQAIPVRTPPELENPNPIVALTRRRLDATPVQNPPLNEMAGSMHVSPFYLNRLFRREVGIPPHDYLLQSRIRRSLEILKQNDDISRTARELGFCDQSHFTRLFKRHVGITPGRYLELNQQRPP